MGSKILKKAQAWGIDLIVALIIFSVGILAFYNYAANQSNEAKEISENLLYDGNIIANSLLSEGYPKDWDMNNAVTLGILSSSKINETKIERFYNLAVSDYGKTKKLFNTRYNYYFFLSEQITLSSGTKEGIGNKPLNPDNLVKITRFTIYKDKPVTAYIYMWS